jgi:hypothetical protein
MRKQGPRLHLLPNLSPALGQRAIDGRMNPGVLQIDSGKSEAGSGYGHRCHAFRKL